MSPASDLRDLAAWADYCAFWIEAAARGPNDRKQPAHRTVTFEAATLDEFLTGFRRIAPALEQIATDIDRPQLRVVKGGRS